MVTKISIILILVMFVFSACNAEKEPEGAEVPGTSQTQGTTTAPTTEPDNTAIEPIDKISEGMSLEEVVEILGPPDADIGSGTVIYQYGINEQETWTIGFVIDSEGVFRVASIAIEPLSPDEENISTEPTTATVEIIDDYISVHFQEAEYDEYLHHVETDDMIPDGFVHYEQLRQIGTFFRYIVPAYGYRYDYYLYDFVDQCGQQISLGIRDEEKCDLFNSEKLTTAVDPGDMRYLTEKKDGWSVYAYEDINYHYINGALYFIEWRVNGWCFHLKYDDQSDVAEWSSNYPKDCTGTVMSNMLCLDTAVETLEKLLEAINTPVTIE